MPLRWRILFIVAGFQYDNAAFYLDCIFLEFSVVIVLMIFSGFQHVHLLNFLWFKWSIMIFEIKTIHIHPFVFTEPPILSVEF